MRYILNVIRVFWNVIMITIDKICMIKYIKNNLIPLNVSIMHKVAGNPVSKELIKISEDADDIMINLDMIIEIYMKERLNDSTLAWEKTAKHVVSIATEQWFKYPKK